MEWSDLSISSLCIFICLFVRPTFMHVQVLTKKLNHGTQQDVIALI